MYKISKQCIEIGFLDYFARLFTRKGLTEKEVFSA